MTSPSCSAIINTMETPSWTNIIKQQIDVIKNLFHRIDQIIKSIIKFTAHTKGIHIWKNNSSSSSNNNNNNNNSSNSNNNSKMNVKYINDNGGKKQARWIVTSPRSKPFYPLERGTQKINEAAVIVSARIDHCLRLRSVEAKFDSDRGEALCKTCDMLRYQIYLYDAGDDYDDDDDDDDSTSTSTSSTLVEVVMVKGCGFSFIKEREAIMNAAKGLGGDASAISIARGTPAPARPPIMMKIPSDLLDSYEPPSDVEIEDMLDRNIDQMHSKHDNAVIFSLQNLHSMTSSSQDDKGTADRVSNYIAVKNYNGIRGMIVSIVANRITNLEDDEISEQICNTSLIILMNGIQSLPLEKDRDDGDDNDDNDIDNDFDGYTCFIEQLLPSLLVGVRNYAKNTYTASLAMKCLYLLATSACSPLAQITRIKIGEINTDFHEVVEGAKMYGSVEHLKLEKAASKMLDILYTT